MASEPRQALSGALSDPVRWIRLGATQLTPWLAPIGAAQMLAAKARTDGAAEPPEETSALAIAMTHAGGDPLPMVADLLHDNVGNLEQALSGDYRQWEDYLLQRPGAKSAKMFNAIMPFYANWGSRTNARLREAPVQQDPESSRASAALYTMRHWEFLMLDSGSNWMKALAGETFAPAVKLLEAGKAMEAVAPLVNTALAMPNDVIRVIARMTLPALGSYASPTLLSALSGKPAVMPDVRAFNSQANKAGVTYPDDMTPETLAAFLAGEVLEYFTDTPTAFAIVNSAITWRDDLRARAARVTARMAAETALPPLVWSALNLPAAAERQAASALLDRIVTSDRTLGMRLHHVGTKELVPNQLGWLTDIVTDGLQSRPWMADLSVSVPILRVALEVMPDIIGEAGFMYSEPPPATMASNFLRSVSGIRNWFDGPLAAMKQARHPEVTLPGECPPDSDVTLSVQLLLGATRTTASPIDVPFPEGKEEVEITVMIHAPGFSTSADHKTIRVPRDKPSEIATFTLHSRAPGVQSIDIKFMMGTEILGQCCAVTEVKSEPRPDLKADVTEIDPVGDFTQLQSSAQAVLRVKTLADGGLEWSIQKPGVPLKPLGRSTVSATAAQAEALGATQRPLIKQMLETELSNSDLDAVISQLVVLGYGLFAQIAPATLPAELDALPENALVVVDSDADWIPWELLASDPTGQLWGQRFVLIRAPVMTRPPIAKISPPGTLSPVLNGALLIVGDDVSRPTRLASLTFGAMAARAEPIAREEDLATLCSRVTGKDIVHFACHGRNEPNYHLSFKEGIAGHLLPGHAHSLGLKWGAVVFANACSSGTTDLLLAAFQSFGREFYYAGARPFIGTLGPVPEAEAAEFAGLFYEQFAFAGLPAGQAMRYAKQASRGRFKRPIWLFYCLYGNPSMVRRWSTG